MMNAVARVGCGSFYAQLSGCGVDAALWSTFSCAPSCTEFRRNLRRN